MDDAAWRRASDEAGTSPLKSRPTGMIANGGFGWGDARALGAGGMSAGQPPLFDPELGQIFLKMRTLLELSLWDMARAVGGEPTVIANLEAGAVGSLPPWPELSRLVEEYANLTGIDTQPILARLLQGPAAPPIGVSSASDARAFAVTMPQPARRAAGTPPAYEAGREAAVTGRQGKPPTARPAVTGPVTVPTGERRKPPHARSYVNAPALAALADVVEPSTRAANSARRATASFGRGLRRMLRQRLVAIVGLLVFPAMLAISARLFPLPLYFVISPLPQVVGEPLRAGLDGLVAVLAPVRDGMTWIDVGDPQLRKADRLPERGR